MAISIARQPAVSTGSNGSGCSGAGTGRPRATVLRRSRPWQEPLAQAGHAARTRVRGPPAPGHGGGGGLCLEWLHLRQPVRDRPAHHRHALEWTPLLRPARQAARTRDPERAHETVREGAPLRHLHPGLDRARARAGVQLARRPARGLRGLHQEPGPRGLAPDRQPATTTAASRAGRWTGPPCSGSCRHPRRPHRCGGGLQGRPADPLAGRLRQAGRALRASTGSPSCRSPRASTRPPRWDG